MISVTTISGRTESIDGTDFEVTGGCVLTILDSDDASVAVYAPGAWQSAVVVPAATGDASAPVSGT